MMKAAVVTKSGRLTVWEVPEPAPGPYDVLCRMLWGATCAGTDIHLMDGLHPHPVSFPTILGHESVGRVVAVGSRVRNFREGDLVTRVGAPKNLLPDLGANWGGFAEYGIARDHRQMRADGLEKALWDPYRVNQTVDPDIDPRTAPMIITWRETLSYANRVGIGPGKTVLLIGSGANALSFAAHGCNLDARVIVIGSKKREALFRSFPIAEYLDYKGEGLMDWTRQALSRCGREEADILLDAVGGSDTANALLPLLKREGVFCNYGWNGRRSYGLNPFLAGGSFRVYGDGYDEEESNRQVQSLILQGKLTPEAWYNPGLPVPLSSISRAYDSLRRHEAVKYLIDLGGSYEET